MTANASAHKLRALIGEDEIEFREEIVSFEVGYSPRDQSGIIRTSGRLRLAVLRDPPAEMNPRKSAGRELWHKGQLIKVDTTRIDDMSEYVRHPCGWLYILKEPMPPTLDEPYLDIELGCILSLRSFAQPDDKVAKSSSISRDSAIGGCFTRAGVSATYTGGVSAYPISFELNKQGGGYVDLAGKIAFGGISVLYQNNQGEIVAVTASTRLKPVAEIDLDIGHDEIDYRPSEGGETPCEKITYTGTVTRNKQNEETIITISEEFAPGKVIDPTASGVIVIRRTITTETVTPFTRERIEDVTAPLGLVAPIAFPKSFTMGLESYTKTTHTYEQSDRGRLLTIQTTEQKLYPAAMPDFFKRQSGTNREILKGVTIYSKNQLKEHVYTEKDIIESTRILTQEPIGAVVPNENHTDGAVLIYSEIVYESWEESRKREWWHRTITNRPIIKVQPGITIDTTDTDERVAIKTALITATNNLEISNSGQTQPPACERRPQTSTYEEVQLEGIARFGTYPGSDQQERERTFNLDVGCVSVAQLTELAQIEGALLMGRRLGQQIQIPLVDELIENPQPLTQWNCTEVDGSINSFAADAIQYTHQRDRAVVGCNGIWLGIIENIESIPTPTYSSGAVIPPYSSIEIDTPAESSESSSGLIIAPPRNLVHLFTGGIRVGGFTSKVPYSISSRDRNYSGGVRIGGVFIQQRKRDYVGGVRIGAADWERRSGRMFLGGVRIGGNLAEEASGSPLLTGLLGYWKFNGDATDEVGDADMTADTGVQYYAGHINDAVSFYSLFDGTEKLTVTDPDLTMGDQITVNFWIRSFPTVTFLKREDDGDVEWRFYAESSDGLIFVTFVVRDDMGSNYSVQLNFNGSGFSSQTNTFMMTGWYDGTNLGIELREYETGTIASNTSEVSITLGGLPDATLQVGSGFMSSYTYFDALGLWDVALTSDQRADLWNSGAGIEHPFEA